MSMTTERMSRLQRRILAWLLAEDQRTRGTMAADHQDLVQALVAFGFEQGNVSRSLKGLEAKGLVTIARTPGGHAKAVALTPAGRREQGLIQPRPRGRTRQRHQGVMVPVQTSADPSAVQATVQSRAVQTPDTGAPAVQTRAELPIPAALAAELGRLWAAIAVQTPDTGAPAVQTRAELPIPAALAAELGRLWAAIEVLQQEMHRPVQTTVQSVPEPMFEDPTDNATERWNLYVKHGLRVQIEALAQARGIAPSRVVQELLWQALAVVEEVR